MAAVVVSGAGAETLSVASVGRATSTGAVGPEGTVVSVSGSWALAKVAAKPVMIAKRIESPDMSGNVHSQDRLEGEMKRTAGAVP